MDKSIWSHDAVVGAVITLVGLLLTNVLNNAVTSYLATKKGKADFKSAATGDVRENSRLDLDRETAMRDMALKTWASVQLAMESEIARQKERYTDEKVAHAATQAERDTARAELAHIHAALDDLGVSFAQMVTHERLYQVLQDPNPPKI